MGGHYFMEWKNTRKTRNSYVITFSLQCLISTSCISLDRAQQPLHAGTHNAETWWLVFASLPEFALRELLPSCSCIQFPDTRTRATRAPAWRAQRAISSHMQLMGTRHCREDLQAAAVP